MEFRRGQQKLVAGAVDMNGVSVRLILTIKKI